MSCHRHSLNTNKRLFETLPEFRTLRHLVNIKDRTLFVKPEWKQKNLQKKRPVMVDDQVVSWKYASVIQRER